MPFFPVTPACVLADAPITWQLFRRIKDDLDHLKATVSDGAAAPQDMATANYAANGPAVVTGNMTLGPNVYGVPTLVQGPGGTLHVDFKDKVWVDGYEVNASGQQFAPNFGDIVWGELVNLSLALGLVRGEPFLIPHKEEG